MEKGVRVTLSGKKNSAVFYESANIQYDVRFKINVSFKDSKYAM